MRELEHIIERAVLLAEGDVLTVNVPFLKSEHIPQSVAEQSEPRALKTLAEMERIYMEEVLRHTNGLIAGKGGAAEILDLPASTYRLEERNIEDYALRVSRTHERDVEVLFNSRRR